MSVELLGHRIADRGWRDRAACGRVDPELFFPVGTGAGVLAQTARAKAVCARCSVCAECLAFALVAIPEGVAGGLSAEQRGKLRERRRRVAVGRAGSSSAAPVAPSGVDGLVVDRLVAGHAVVGASRDERAFAAVVMHRAGRGVGVIAARVGVGDRQVHRWLARERVGRVLNPGPAHGRSVARGRGVAS